MLHEDKYTITLDDDPTVAQLIAGFTQLHSHSFANAEEMLAKAASLSPLAVFVDVHLKNQGLGLDHIPKIRSVWPQAAILVITADTEPDLVGRALAAGANDFVLKPIAKPELLARLKARLCEMTVRNSSEFIELGSGRFNVRKRYIEAGGNTVYLSPLQAELLQVLLESEGVLVPKDVVKKAIWGKIAVSDNALDRRLSEMRKILRESACDMQIVSEYGKGISLQYRGAVMPRRIPA